MSPGCFPSPGLPDQLATLSSSKLPTQTHPGSRLARLYPSILKLRALPRRRNLRRQTSHIALFLELLLIRITDLPCNYVRHRASDQFDLIPLALAGTPLTSQTSPSTRPHPSIRLAIPSHILNPASSDCMASWVARSLAISPGAGFL